MSEVAQGKNEMRKRMRALRESLGADERNRIDAIIADRVCDLAEYRNADAVFTYLSVGSEIDTREIIRDAWRQGKLVAVPRCIPGTNRMEWYEIHDFENLETSSFGVEEPVANPACLVEVPSSSDTNAVALVPGYSFDAAGYRVGYGGGFYDVFLPTFGGASVGLCRAVQFSEEPLPHDDYDQAVQVVVTD